MKSPKGIFFHEGGRGSPPTPLTIKKPGCQGKSFLKDLLTCFKKLIICFNDENDIVFLLVKIVD